MAAAAPSWDALYEVAAGQEGHFSTAQAAEAGYSPQLLAKYLSSGKIVRARRGVYRLVHFPPGEREELVVVWLWAEQAGVFSHDTALDLHGLSDILPARAHVTVPRSWSERRLRVPKEVRLHYGDVAKRERVWIGSVPVTSPQRTLADCIVGHLTPEILDQAIAQAHTRGMVTKEELAALKKLRQAQRAAG